MTERKTAFLITNLGLAHSVCHCRTVFEPTPSKQLLHLCQDHVVGISIRAKGMCCGPARSLCTTYDVRDQLASWIVSEAGAETLEPDGAAPGYSVSASVV